MTDPRPLDHNQRPAIPRDPPCPYCGCGFHHFIDCSCGCRRHDRPGDPD